MADVLVLGGEGFIGSHIVRELVARGHAVTVSTRRERPTTQAPVRSVFVDFLNASDLASAVAGHEYVIHCISLTNPAVSHADPFIDVETNVRMSIHLFEACRSAGVRRVVFLSSGGAIYGDSRSGAIAEWHATSPISPYGIGKLAIEGYLRFYRRKFGLDSLVLRLSNVYGPGQRTSHGRHGVISVFLDRARAGQPIQIFGDGSMSRDYVYVEDVATLIATQMFLPKHHDIYNVGSGEGTTVLQLAEAVQRAVGRPLEREYVPVPTSYVREIVLDCSRAQQEWGPLDLTPIKRGIELTCEYSPSRG